MEDLKSKYNNNQTSSHDTDSPSDNDDEQFCDDIECDYSNNTTQKSENESINGPNSNILPRKLLR